MKKCFYLLVFCSLLVSACATNSQSGQSYADYIAQISAPVNENERQSKCAWIRSEIARQQNIANYAAGQMQGMYAMAAQMQSRNNIATLESRASVFNCYSAFSGTRSEPSKIEACVSSCKLNTSRSAEQCFDSCNH